MFAYLDKGAIIHVVGERKTAEENAAYNGKIIETGLGDGAGYLFEKGKRIFVYAKEKEFYEGGNAKGGRKMSENEFQKRYPGSYSLFKALI